MKKAILSSILLLSASSIFADTTMCFKENHQSMSTIENTPIDGGLCMGKNFMTYARYGIVDLEKNDDESTRGRLHVQYTF